VRNCSSAAAIAAASDREAVSVTSSICGRGGFRAPFLGIVVILRALGRSIGIV
jgi:hypothetical protein